MIVVKAAMMMMKIGMRTESGMTLRKAEIRTSEQRRTKVMARPMPIAFDTEVVTARAEQRPIMSMSRGFSKMIPCLNTFQSRFIHLPPVTAGELAARSSQVPAAAPAALTILVSEREVMVEA